MKVRVTFELDTDEAGPLPTPIEPDTTGALCPSAEAIRAAEVWWTATLLGTTRQAYTPRLIAIEAKP